MGEQDKLIERLKSVRVGSAKWTNALNRLLDAARTEGRGEGEPVAWQEAAEPFFRLAREVINPVNGERPWHADSKDWMVVFSFAGQSVTLGDLRRAAVASPIREPEISREAETRLAQGALHDADDISGRIHAGGYRANLSDVECLRNHVRRLARAILSLAPVGGRGEEGSSQSHATMAHIASELDLTFSALDQHQGGTDG